MQALGTSLRNLQLEVEASGQSQVVDITDLVAQAVAKAGVVEGVVWIFCRHTTCGVWINEFEDGLAEDLSVSLNNLVGEGYYAHDDLARRTQNLTGPNEPANAPAHLRQILFGATSQMVPIVNGEIALGRWQRVLFIEFDIPRPRTLLLTLLG